MLTVGPASGQEAGIHVAGLERHPAFSELGRDTIYYQQLGLREVFPTR